jgi:hypothetical protein
MRIKKLKGVQALIIHPKLSVGVDWGADRCECHAAQASDSNWIFLKGLNHV